MEVLGIGPSELVMVVLIALVVLGPRDMQKAGRTLGRWLNALVHSDSWKVVQKTSHELRNLPTNLMREANLEMIKTEADIRKAIHDQNPDNSNKSDPPHNRSSTTESNSTHIDSKSEAEDAKSTDNADYVIQPPHAPAKNEQTLKGK